MAVHKKTKCTDNREDCFGYRMGYCRVLDSGIENCPFYKTQKQHNMDLLKYPVHIMDYRMSDKQIREEFGLREV